MLRAKITALQFRSGLLDIINKQNAIVLHTCPFCSSLLSGAFQRGSSTPLLLDAGTNADWNMQARTYKHTNRADFEVVVFFFLHNLFNFV